MNQVAKNRITSYKDLIVWQKSVELVLATYELTDKFPKTEMYGLTSQMRRAAVSVPSNIAEGTMRGTRKDYKHFVHTAFGSSAELETQIEIVKKLAYVKQFETERLEEILKEVMKMLNRLVISLKKEFSH